MKSLFVCLFVLCIASIHAEDIDHLIFKSMSDKPTKDQFKVFHYLFKKPYDLNSEQSLSKYRIFKANLKSIEKHNKVNTDFVQGITFFADFSREEYVQFATNNAMLKNRANLIKETNTNVNFDNISEEEDDDTELTQDNDTYPDYRDFLGPTKDQGTCGGCWAFATSQMAEFAVYKSLGKKVVLSPQSLIDCDIYASNQGCDGGDFPLSLLYIKENGIALEKDYPYKEIQGSCKHTSVKYKITDFDSCQNYYYSGCRQELKRDMKKGPVGVGIDITAEGWQFYRGGYFNNPCYEVAHAVIAFYRDRQGIYFLNSWGEYGWGENKGAGRVRFSRANGLITCGLENESHLTLSAKLS